MLASLLLCNANTVNAQVSHYYNTNGYFFSPAPRALARIKSLTLVSTSTYEAELADIGSLGYKFRFQVDNNNHLVNWVAVGSTPASSGFMTADNPGNIDYNGGGIVPGTNGYTSAIYNNTYDPETHTFYLHNGYVAGGNVPANQNQFTRQIYEKWEDNIVQIDSLYPRNITEGTVVTVKGTNLTGITAAGFGFGSMVPAQSFTALSDSEMHVVVGKGADGGFEFTTSGGTFSTEVFSYTAPVQPIAPWQYTGNRGFGIGNSWYVNMTVDKNDVPYVVFDDGGLKHIAVVKKFVNNNCVQVGDTASVGEVHAACIAIAGNNQPWIVYLDSLNGYKVTVRKFTGTSWVQVGAAGFAVSTG